MKKFTNHIDHVTWISRFENIEKNVAAMEKITEAKLVRFARLESLGMVVGPLMDDHPFRGRLVS